MFKGANFGAVTICVCLVAMLKVADARLCNSRGGTSVSGLKMALKVLSTRSRVYLSGGSVEFGFICSESWVLSVIMVLSCGSSTVAGIRSLVEVVLVFLSGWSLPNQCHVHRLEGCVQRTRLCGWNSENWLFLILDQCHVHRLSLCGQNDHSNSLLRAQGSITRSEVNVTVINPD